jgi:DNA-binding transcriptional regulator YiaG
LPNTLGPLLDKFRHAHAGLLRTTQALNKSQGAEKIRLSTDMQSALSELQLRWAALQSPLDRLRVDSTYAPLFKALDRLLLVGTELVQTERAIRIIETLLTASAVAVQSIDECITVQIQEHRQIAPAADMLASSPSANEAGIIQIESIRVAWTKDGWGSRLKTARQARQHTQKEASSQCNASEETLRKWEAGRKPSGRYMTAILNYIQPDGRPHLES